MTDESSLRRPVCGLIAAGGSGTRYRNASNSAALDARGKLWEDLGGKPLWEHSVRALVDHPAIAAVIMAVPKAMLDEFSRAVTRMNLPVRCVLGGAERHDSVAAMLDAAQEEMLRRVPETTDFGTADFDIAVHDAARPLLHRDDLDRVLACAAETGAAFLATPVTASLHRRVAGGASGSAGGASRAVDRRDLFAAATPQVFRADWFIEANRRHRGRIATDDVTLMQRSGRDVAIVEGRSDNIKITQAADLEIARAILGGR
ncbi:MAG: IspD/TarI family cytidylyltransferase [Planctomycetota bacterium]